ncbi:hypothetical protein [Nocardia blacklockiae]|uniref:hypothetical protein n=1 Tax=Nocardia blacklockiae TaxID=480036 RepID=UPI001893AE64|nr:hypothetical protein [Nocardia blacklockiae]MBF6173831.1 hypothetical protein [Nocardia blacklockiae]
MPFEVSPDSLRGAAGVMAALPNEIDQAPPLGAGPEAEKLNGSTVGAALSRSDPLSRRAKDLLKARYNQFAGLLAFSADTFHNTDVDAAERIAAVGDINDAGAGK